ncbi:MAG: TRAP transporter substrate-binding protein DctP [Bacteriovoracaceae bacterium]|nr:TRAP transporter substrate-binding protein DctP [Bacteriovoracaceae bacterium]
MKIFTLLFLLLTSSAYSAVNLKLAVLVPEGTTWGDSLKKFTKEVEVATKGEVALKVYYGGVAGDEPDVLRKIRIGQMHGGIFTGKTLGDINGDVRVMELPFMFGDDRAKAWSTLEKMAPTFNKALESKGFVNIGFYEVGQVYVVSTKKVESLAALRGIKVWAWEGDELVKAMIESAGLVSTPLAITDVLSSLSTGIIDAAYAPPLGILALQWQSKVKYLIDFPTAWSMGALLISKKEWSKVPANHQMKIMEVAKVFVQEANQRTVKENEQARETLKKLGIEFIKFSEADKKEAQAYHKKVVEKLQGKLFSPQIYSGLGVAK